MWNTPSERTTCYDNWINENNGTKPLGLKHTIKIAISQYN